MGAGQERTDGNRSDGPAANPQGRPVGGQASFGLFEVTAADRCHAERAASQAPAGQQGAQGLRECRKNFAAQSAEAQACQADDYPRIVNGLTFGQGLASIPALIKQPVPKEKAALAANAAPARPHATAALPSSICHNTKRAPLFDEEAALEYEAWLDEVAEAHARQLDDEADRYAHSHAGAGWTEFLMASEG